MIGRSAVSISAFETETRPRTCCPSRTGDFGKTLSFEKEYLGDIIISVETAQRQALDRNHSLERELQILVIHGLLHLLGHDHETDQGQMRRKELMLQRKLL